MDQPPPTVWLDGPAPGADASTAADLVDRACGRLRLLARKLFRLYPSLDTPTTAALLHGPADRLRRSLAGHGAADVPALVRFAAAQVRRELIATARAALGTGGAEGGAATLDFSPHDTHASRRDAGGPPHDPARWAAWVAFHDTVDGLPDDERAAVDYLWYLALPPAAVAALLGTDRPTLERRWLAARLRLAEQLNGRLPPED